jgi:hypothetical protein
MVSDHKKVAIEMRCGIHMAMQVSHAVKDGPVPGLEFPGLCKPFNADIMIAGKDQQRDTGAQGFQYPGHLMVFLPGEGWDAVLDVPQQHEPVGIGTVNRFLEPFKPVGAPAPEMQAVGSKIRLDPEMEVRNNEQPLIPFHHQCRPVADEFEVHNCLTYPFCGW